MQRSLEMMKNIRFGGRSIRFVALLAVMTAMVILPLGAAAKGADNGGSGMLTVNVTSAWNGIPLSGAAVQVWDQFGNQAAAGVTSDSGTYQVLLSVGYYKVVAQAKNYTMNEAEGAVVLGGISTVNIALDWNGSTPPPGGPRSAQRGGVGIR
jgi:hypothetical protein